MEVALAHAIADGAVVQFATFPLLLAQLPAGLRLSVAAAMDQHQPFAAEEKFYWAHVRTDAVCDGQWGVVKFSGLHAGIGFVIACDEISYTRAIAHLREVFARQRASGSRQ